MMAEGSSSRPSSKRSTARRSCIMASKTPAACEAGAVLVVAGTQRTLWRTLGTERTIAQQLCDDCKDLERDLADGHQLGQAVLYGLTVVGGEQRDLLLSLVAQARGNNPHAA